MKKSFLLAIAALCATMTFAITPQELADSLNVFASERAYLGKVKVSDIQIAAGVSHMGYHHPTGTDKVRGHQA